MKSELLLLIAFSIFVSVSNGYSNSLADCKTVAKLFKNTCTGAPDTAATWFTNFPSTQVTCTTMPICPVGYGDPGNCSWPRKLCVTCSQDSTTAKVYMRIQSNTLPDFCSNTSITKDAPKEKLLDYKILFNPTVSSSGSSLKTFANQTDFDTTACKMEKTQTVPSTSEAINLNTTGFSAKDDAVMSGILLDGIVLFSSLSGDLVDPFFPKSWSGGRSVTPVAETVDACLGHPGGGVYHIHTLSPCILSLNDVQTALPCTSIDACMNDVRSYSLSFFTSSLSTLKVLGIAKDGHLMVGPYKSDGSMFDCSTLDQCGGIFLDDGSYVYPFHSQFPYTMDCFGPAQTLKYEASCTTNTCSSSKSSSRYIIVYYITFISISFLLLVL